MTRLLPALGCVGLLVFCGLWTLEPWAMVALPALAQGAGVGLAQALTAVGVGTGFAVLLVGAGLAVRAARLPHERPPLLYGPPERALDEARIIEGEYTDV